MGVSYNVKFARDTNPNVKTFYEAHHAAHEWNSDALSDQHIEGPTVDVYCSGWPCQGLSRQGHMMGEADQRTQVWQGAVSYIENAQPKAWFMESVPTLISESEPLFRKIMRRVLNIIRGS